MYSMFAVFWFGFEWSHYHSLFSCQITIEKESGQDVTAPKHGKIDPNNAPHVGGNQWAGGTGNKSWSFVSLIVYLINPNTYYNVKTHLVCIFYCALVLWCSWITCSQVAETQQGSGVKVAHTGWTQDTPSTRSPRLRKTPFQKKSTGQPERWLKRPLKTGRCFNITRYSKSIVWCYTTLRCVCSLIIFRDKCFIRHLFHNESCVVNNLLF